MSIDGIADRMRERSELGKTLQKLMARGMPETRINGLTTDERWEIIERAKLAANDDAQWSSKELKQVIRDLLRVTGL